MLITPLYTEQYEPRNLRRLETILAREKEIDKVGVRDGTCVNVSETSGKVLANVWIFFRMYVYMYILVP